MRRDLMSVFIDALGVTEADIRTELVRLLREMVRAVPEYPTIWRASG